MSTPAQSKIEFAAHLIKISSQIGGDLFAGLFAINALK